MSSNKTLSALDYVVFGGMLCVSSGIGIFYAWKDRHQKNNKEFLLAGGKLGVLPVSMSLLASFISAVTVLGIPAEMFSHGIHFWVNNIAAMIGVFITIYVFLPVFYPLKLTSINKYLQLRFQSNAVRLATTVSLICSQAFYLGVVLYGPSLALGSVTGMSVWSSILLIGLCCTFYTTIGGLKAVVWTDVFQMTIIVIGMMMVVVKGGIDIGFKQIWEIGEKENRITTFNMKPDLFHHTNFWNIMLGTGISWTCVYGVNQTQVQRYCSSATYRIAKISLYINMFGLMIVGSIASLCGLVAFAAYHDCDPLQKGEITAYDQIMPYYVIDKLNSIPCLPGLYVASVFSGSLSTLSSGFNSLAAVTWDDFLKNFCPVKGKKSVLITKAIAASYGFIAIAFAFVAGRVDSVIQAVNNITAAIYGPMLAVYLLGVLVPFANKKGVLLGLILGEACSLWIVAGSFTYKKPSYTLPTSTAGCLATPNMSLHSWTNTTEGTTISIDEDESQFKGLLGLYHIAYILIPVVSNLIALTVGIVVSLISGGLNQKVDPKLLFPGMRRFSRFIEEDGGKKTEAELIGFKKDLSNHTGQEDLL